jgi:hypothetical protein
VHIPPGGQHAPTLIQAINTLDVRLPAQVLSLGP